jgi:hypothetical protein
MKITTIPNVWAVIPEGVVNRSARHGFVVVEGDFPRRLLALRARNEDTPPAIQKIAVEAHFWLCRREAQAFVRETKQVDNSNQLKRNDFARASKL